MILVTGGTGLVGSHLLISLLKAGKKVRSLYRTETSIRKTKTIFELYNQIDLFEKIDWVKADVTDIPALEIAFKNINIVYHCAALISFNPKDDECMRKTNIEGTANIVNLSLYNNIKKLCYVSSIAALGHAKLPDEYIDENSEWNPEFALDGYAISKHGAELEVWRAQEEGLATIIVNPGIIIGAGFWNQGSGLLFSKIKKGHYFYTLGTNGYVGVHDVVKIMLTLMEKETTGENYVLVSENLSYKQVFDLIATYLKVNKPKYYARPWMTALAFHLKNMLQYAHTQTKYDNKKITTQLEYVFEPIEKSIKDTAEMYR